MTRVLLVTLCLLPLGCTPAQENIVPEIFQTEVPEIFKLRAAFKEPKLPKASEPTAPPQHLAGTLARVDDESLF